MPGRSPGTDAGVGAIASPIESGILSGAAALVRQGRICAALHDAWPAADFASCMDLKRLLPSVFGDHLWVAGTAASVAGESRRA